MQQICHQMQEQNITKAIIVMQMGMTPTARMSVINLMEEFPKYRIELFLEAELMVNITEHELVPEHVSFSNSFGNLNYFHNLKDCHDKRGESTIIGSIVSLSLHYTIFYIIKKLLLLPRPV
jgi:hypothetical protein